MGDALWKLLAWQNLETLLLRVKDHAGLTALWLRTHLGNLLRQLGLPLTVVGPIPGDELFDHAL